MRSGVFRICAHFLCQQIRISYARDIFTLIVLEHPSNYVESVIVLSAQKTPKSTWTWKSTWKVPISNYVDGRKLKGSLLTLSLKNRREVLDEAKSKDAPFIRHTNTIAGNLLCQSSFLKSESSHSRDSDAMTRSEDNPSNSECLENLVISSELLFTLFQCELKRHKKKDMVFTFNWETSNGPRLYVESIPRSLHMQILGLVTLEHKWPQEPSNNAITIGPFEGYVKFDREELNTELGLNGVEKVLFDFGRLLSEIPEIVFLYLVSKVEELIDKNSVTVSHDNRVTFQCNPNVYEAMPFMKIMLVGRTYRLTSKEYIVEIPNKEGADEAVNSICSLALKPVMDGSLHEWIIGATFLKRHQMKMIEKVTNRNYDGVMTLWFDGADPTQPRPYIYEIDIERLPFSTENPPAHPQLLKEAIATQSQLLAAKQV